MSTPVSRTMLDLDRFRRMRQRATSAPTVVMTSPPPPPPPPPSTPSSTPTPKKVMTWKQLEATLTPKEKRAMLTSRRSNSAGRPSSQTTPNENRPMNNNGDKRNAASSTRNSLSVSTQGGNTDFGSSSSTPKSPRRQRVHEKGHLLASYNHRSATPEIPDLDSNGTGLTAPMISSSSSSLDIPPPPKSPGRERLVEKGRHYLSSSHSLPATPDILSLQSSNTPKSPKSPRRQRLFEKGHLLKGRSKTPPSSPGAGLTQTLAKLSTSSNIPGSILKQPKPSSTLDVTKITIKPAAMTPAARSTNTTPSSSSINLSDFQTPRSTLLSSTKSAANSRPFQTPQSAFTTPQSSITTTPMTTPSTFDRSRSASVELRRSATPGRWRSASRLYARASSPGRSKSRVRATNNSTKTTPDEKPRSQSTGRLQSAAKLYARAMTPDQTATSSAPKQQSAAKLYARAMTPNETTASSASKQQSAAKLYARAMTPDETTASSASKQQQRSEEQESTLWKDDRRSRSMQKARHAMARKSRSKTPERGRKLSPPRPTATSSMTSLITSSGGSTRRNLDKRTARLMHANSFASDISKYRQESASPRPVHSIDNNLLERGNMTGGVSVVVRKRPIFEYEQHAGDFDVVFTEARSEDSDVVVVYSTMMHADMRQMLVKPHAFACSAAFDDDCSNDALYLHVGQPLVERVVLQGGMATLLMFGQTGSGKTHTMSGMEEHMANSLFELLENDEYQSRVTVQFVELSGKLCRDLLEDGDVRVAENEDGSVRLLNAACMEVANAKELYEVICYGKRRRATEATGRNGVSSRSHAVCQITVTRNKADTSRRGVLTLLDCAGTERRNDSVHHSRERQKESAEINASLWALKECIRARADKGKRMHVPYRSSNLTRVLRETLENEDALLCVVATVAPNATDTEHTLETLRTVSTLVGMDGNLEEGETHVVSNSPTNAKEEELLTPKQWNHEQLVDFLKRKRLLPTNNVPSHLDGRLIMRMSPVQLKNLLYDKDNADKADALFRLLRAENDRVSRILIKRRLASSQNQPVAV